MSAVEAAPSQSQEVRIEQIQLARRSRAPYRSLDPEGHDRAEQLLKQGRDYLSGRTVWSVTFHPGGGLIDILNSVLGYVRDGGIDAEWLLLRANGGFPRVARRLYNNLYGSAGDGGPLGEKERAALEEIAAAAAGDLTTCVRPGDVVFLHDPPTAALVEPAREAGAHVIWRCHLGVDAVNEHARRAQEFLLPFVGPADAYAFTRREHAWEGLEQDKVSTIPPSLDPLSARNQELSPGRVLAILDRIGLTKSRSRAAPTFIRQDGSPERVNRRAVIDQDAPIPSGAPVVAQVASWERLKDQGGALEAFAQHCDSGRAHLALVGPAVEGHREEKAVLAEVRGQRDSLPADARGRIHLVSLPVDDQEENAAMVNAIQRRSDVIVQKSLAEGFGLSVTEAMWKGKPVIAAKVGGIRDQIVDGESGILIEDPGDLAAFGNAMGALLADRRRRLELGTGAKVRVQQGYLTPSHVCRYLELVGRVAK